MWLAMGHIFVLSEKHFRLAPHYLGLKSEPYNPDQNTIESEIK